MISAADLAALLDAELQPDLTIAAGEAIVAVTSLLRIEQRASTAVPRDRTCWAPNKVAIDFEGTPTWEEYVIVRLLERHGWWACWVKNWYGTREFCAGSGRRALVPPDAYALLARIEQANAGATSGVWDVFAWKGGRPLFIEAKQHRSTDRINSNQASFLTAALSVGVEASRFAVVNYDAGTPMRPVLKEERVREAPAAPRSTVDAGRRRAGILDDVSGAPPAAQGNCAGVTADGRPCGNMGRYWVDGKLSCSRKHATYR